MSAPEDRDSPPAPAKTGAGRRRFLQRAGTLVASAPVAVALVQTGEAATTTKKKSSAAAAAKPKPTPAADLFAASRPDVSLARNAEERAAMEKQWKAMQEALELIRKAPLDPSTEPVTVFAAMARTPARED